MNSILLVLIVTWAFSSVGCQSPAPNAPIDEASPGDRTISAIVPNDDYSIASEKPIYRVWYGTNRKPLDEADLTKGFSSRETKFSIMATRLYPFRRLISLVRLGRHGHIGLSR